ncbi:branched-chain amino acid ABC transporter permease [Rhizobium sp. L1K21]|uniref:branched-chain amino acid ABC transporter permease n=1 Tax=Rhizobium sp. L1K21 TaxID=2954933 RepID=UPI002091E93F|nr:branched-chain amino acid ABC transporter permease [Rhizobium sp. L1K21]MCO6187867.1 branched-chain amino acid ABC transporter permease [Rhizobium sp. L1K21]
MTSGFVIFGRLALAAGLICLCIAPFAFTPAVLVLLTQALSMLSLAMLWNLVAGYGNVMVIGQHAFVGIGAYAFYGFAMLAGLHMAVALPAAMAVTLAFGSMVYAMLYRLRTAYLAVGSWVVAETLMLVASRLPGFGGGSGASLPANLLRTFGARVPERLSTIYIMVLAVAVLTFVLIWALMRSRIGLGLAALRDNEEGAAVAGVNTRLVRAACFILAAPMVGLVGVLVTLQEGRISPVASFSMLDWTIYVLFIVVIGGLGSLEGPIIGTLVFFLLRELLQDYGTLYLITLGAISILIVLFAPTGLWGLARRKLGRDLIPLTHDPKTGGAS